MNLTKFSYSCVKSVCFTIASMKSSKSYGSENIYKKGNFFRIKLYNTKNNRGIKILFSISGCITFIATHFPLYVPLYTCPILPDVIGISLSKLISSLNVSLNNFLVYLISCISQFSYRFLNLSTK